MSLAKIERYLESGGWKRSVAGNADFETRRNAEWYEAKVREAAARLPKGLRRFRSLLWAIYRNGKKKRISKKELGVSNWWYREGLRKFKKFFLGQ